MKYVMQNYNILVQAIHSRDVAKVLVFKSQTQVEHVDCFSGTKWIWLRFTSHQTNMKTIRRLVHP